jgi:hypothetical protein
VTVRAGAGVGGSDRVTIVWPDGAIVNTWLRVTVLANSNTALAAPDVHYWGNAIGETGSVTGDARVDFADRIAILQNLSAGPVAATNRFDINRDRIVDATDAAIVDAHLTGLNADLNRDDFVGIADLSAIQAHFGAVSPGPYDGDLDGDGLVGRTDVAILAMQYGTGASPTMLANRLPLISTPAQSSAAIVAQSAASESQGATKRTQTAQEQRRSNMHRSDAQASVRRTVVATRKSSPALAVTTGLRAVRSNRLARVLLPKAVDSAFD